MLLAWTHAIPTRCTHAYEVVSQMNPSSYTHAPICPCFCIPSICMYVHAHAISPHDPPPYPMEPFKRKTTLSILFLVNCHALSYCPCHVATLSPCLPLPPSFPPACQPFDLVVPPSHICFIFLLSHVCFGDEILAGGSFSFNKLIGNVSIFCSHSPP